MTRKQFSNKFAMDNMFGFQDSIHGMLTWFLDVRSELIDLEGEHRAFAIASHIANCHRNLNLPEGDLPVVQKKGVPFDLKSYMSEDSKYREPIKDLYYLVNEELKDYISHFFLLSSLATLDYKRGWSDIDSFMVINDDTVKDEKKLNMLRKICLSAWSIFLRITPLQHHGFIVSTPQDLRSYPSHYMPPAVFDNALCLIDNQKPIDFLVRSGASGSLKGLKARISALREAVETGVFKHHPKDGKYLLSHFENADDSMFQLFCLLGYVMTVPAYYMDGIGKGCYKGDSFVLSRPAFSDRAWKILNRATEIRSEWELREGTNYKGNAIPLWLQKILGKDYIEDSLYLVEEAVVNILRDRGN
jgi:hypothetical protein